MVEATGGFLFQKNPQYTEEVTYNTKITASPTYLWIGAVDLLDPSMDPGIIYRRQLGSEDLYKALATSKAFAVRMEYLWQNKTFAQYGIAAQGGGAGTIDKSLQFVWSQDINTVENFSFLTGARINTIKVASKPKEPVRVTCDLIGAGLSTPSSASGLTTPTHATDPATDPHVWEDGGVGNIDWGGIDLDCTEFEFTVNRNLEPIYTDSNELKYLVPRHRDISGLMTVVLTTTTNITDLMAATERTLIWVMKSAGDTATFTNVTLTKLDSLRMAAEEVTFQKFSFTARSIAVA